MRKIFATIYGKDEDDCQSIRVNYEYFLKRNNQWFTDAPDQVRVNYVWVMSEILIDPSDLKHDIEVAIAEDLGFEPGEVTIECEIRKQVVKRNQIAA